jgi:phosphonate transport system ATP-binding protein
MRDGAVVFDGAPDELTTSVARQIYGADEGFSERSTSTSIEALEPVRLPIREPAYAV